MDKNHDTIAFGVSLITKAVIMVAQFSGGVRKRSLKRLAVMDIDSRAVDERAMNCVESGLSL